MRTVLTIAGSDCSGGAGVQADIKTIAAHRLYAMSAITALTAQNTTGVYGVAATAPAFLGQQLDCVFQDIPPDAVKIGMVFDEGLIEVIAERLERYGARNVVVDPVMIATSGSRLLCERAQQRLAERLLPLGDVITPNIPEAEALCGFAIRDEADMLRAAEALRGRIRGGVLIKGGHLAASADDLLLDGQGAHWFRAPRVDNPNTHGTGCTLSSAIACNLALGSSVAESVAQAKAYVTGALAAGLNLGRGSGPLDHGYWLARRGGETEGSA